jgi:GR25 family glycosyltransferase involved in LPS biosynthesis
MNIQSKIIHLTEDGASVRPSENYFNRKTFLVNDTIPKLKSMNIDVSFFDAIAYKDLIFDRNFEWKTHEPKKIIEYKNKSFLVDNPFGCAFELALWLGHNLLWEECAMTGKSMLILEDDVMIKDEEKDNIQMSIQNFESFIKEPAILYLQSTSPCTPNPKNKLKGYPQEKLYKVNSLYKVNNSHGDWSGSAAYVVNPLGANKLLERSKNIGAKCIDGFIHRAIQEKYINAYIPEKYTQSIHLHPNYS